MSHRALGVPSAGATSDDASTAVSLETKAAGGSKKKGERRQPIGGGDPAAARPSPFSRYAMCAAATQAHKEHDYDCRDRERDD